MGRHFYEIKPIETHFRKKIPTFSDFEEIQGFFSTNRSIFPENPHVLNILRNIKIPVSFYGEFATIWWKNMLKLGREQSADVGVNAIGNQKYLQRKPNSKNATDSVKLDRYFSKAKNSITFLENE